MTSDLLRTDDAARDENPGAAGHRGVGATHRPTAPARRGRDVEDPASRMRAVILDGARALFAERGFQKTTMADLAALAGGSPANLYNYFPSKKAIGFAVVEHYVNELYGRLAALEAAPPADAAAHLRAFVRIRALHVVEHLRARPRLVELAEMVLDEAEGADVVEAFLATEFAGLAAIIERGVAEGAFAPTEPRTAARAVHLATRYFMTPRAIAAFGLDTAEADLETTLDLVCAGLR